MPVNLVDLVKNQFSSDFTARAAAALGENESGIDKSLNASIPAALGAMLQKSESKGGAAEILSASTKAVENPLLGNLAQLFSGGASTSGLMGMASGLFSNKITDIISNVASFAGIKASSASSIINLVAPAALAVVGKYADQNNLSAADLVEFLKDQRTHVLRSVPGGFNLGSVLGLAGIPGIENAADPFGDVGGEGLRDTIESADESVLATEGERRKNGAWIIPFLVAIIAMGVIWYLTKGCGNTASVVERTVINDTNSAQMKASDSLQNTVALQLPNGSHLTVKKGGLEDQLVNFLQSDYKDLNNDSLKNVWFNLDSINFKTDSATITPESQTQINNIAVILNAFPEAKVKIGGYSDKTGNESHNKKLSAERARAVADALDLAGVSKQVVGSEGYGSQFAKYSENAADSDRVKDRHISLSFRK